MIGGLIFLALVALIGGLFAVPFFRKDKTPRGRLHNPPGRSDLGGPDHL